MVSVGGAVAIASDVGNSTGVFSDQINEREPKEGGGFLR